MAAADLEHSPQAQAPVDAKRTTWTAIRDKLHRVLHNTDNRDLDPYRVEVAAIIETLDTVNRDIDGLSGRGLRGDTHRS